MFRIKVIDYMAPNTYKWFNTAEEAKRIAQIIIKNKYADIVEVENLKEKKVIAIYQLQY